MAITAVDYLLLDGNRYAMKPDGYRRTFVALELDQLIAKRVQSPFVDSETIGYGGGEGLKTVDDEAAGYWTALGMEPVDEVPASGSRRLKVGRQLTTIATETGAGGVRSLLPWKDGLYVGYEDSGAVDLWDGAALTTAFTLTKASTGVKSFVDLGSGTLLAITEDGGLYRSTDSGVTWTYLARGQLSPDATMAYGGGVLLSPNNPDLFRSFDSGLTWTSLVIAFSPTFGILSLAPLTGTTFLATNISSAAVVQRSTDGGLTWTASATLSGITMAVAVATDGGSTAVMAGRLNGSPDSLKVFRSTDSGVNWTDVHTLAGVANTSAPRSVVYAGSNRWVIAFQDDPAVAVRAIRSTDNGATWSAAVTVLASGGFDVDSLTATDSTHLQLKLSNGTVYYSADGGATWAASNITGQGTGGALVPIGGVTGGVLFGRGATSAQVYRSTDHGVTYAEVSDSPLVPVFGVTAMVAFGRKIWMANSYDNRLATWDGVTLTSSALTTSGSGNGVPTLGATFLSGKQYLFIAVDLITDQVSIRIYDGTTQTEMMVAPEPEAQDLAFVGGTCYVAVAAPLEERGAIYSGQITAGSWGLAVETRGNYAASLGSAGDRLWAGMAWGGSLRYLEGGALEEALRVGSATAPAALPGTDAIYALDLVGDSLYAAGYDAAAPSGQRTWLRRLHEEGWHPISAGGNDASVAIRSLATFEQALYLGDSEATDGRLYSLSKTSRLTSAVLEGANVMYGVPTLQKRWRRIAAQHSALVAGQKVDVRYKLDDGSEVTLGVNQDVGSTETAFELPYTAKGARLRPLFYLTNLAGSDLIVASHAVRALPAPQSRQVWEARLQLMKDDWNDATPDLLDATTKYDNLEALRLTGQPFQVVEPLRENGLPLHAMLAVLDPQVPLDGDLKIFANGMGIDASVRLLQASGPENLLKNASFEQDASGAAPTDWSTTGTGTSSNCDNGAAQDGSNSLKVIFNGAAASYGRQQTVTGLVPGRFYSLSGSIKRATSGGVVNLDVFESGILDTSGIALAAATDSAFARYSEPFLYPLTGSGTVVVRAYGTSTPVGSCLFDAIQLEEAIPASAFRERGSGG